jgi:hypothetical protein
MIATGILKMIAAAILIAALGCILLASNGHWNRRAVRAFHYGFGGMGLPVFLSR